jgi:hypothetical protein
MHGAPGHIHQHIPGLRGRQRHLEGIVDFHQTCSIARQAPRVANTQRAVLSSVSSS